MQGYPYYSFTSFILGTELCVPNCPISIVMEISTSISGYFFFQLNASNLGIELNSFRAIIDLSNGWDLNSCCFFFWTVLCDPNCPISIVMYISTSISGYFFFQLNASNLGIELNSFRAISDQPNGWALNSSCVFFIKSSILSVKFA